MLAPNKHKIRKINVDLRLNGAEYKVHREKLISICRSQVGKLLEEELDILDRPGKVIRIKKLELDLGALNPNDLERDFIQKFRKKIREELGLAIEKLPKEELMSVAEKQGRSFVEYLKSGSLPWSENAGRLPDINDIVTLLIENKLDDALKGFSIVNLTDAAIYRLVKNIQVPLLQRLLIKIEPEYSELPFRETDELFVFFSAHPFFAPHKNSLAVQIYVSLLRLLKKGNIKRLNKEFVIGHIISSLAKIYLQDEFALVQAILQGQKTSNSPLASVVRRLKEDKFGNATEKHLNNTTAIEHYLLYGKYPIWYEGSYSIEKLISTELGQDKAALKAALFDGKDANFISNAVSRLPSEVLEELLKLSGDSVNEQMFKVINQLARLFLDFMPPGVKDGRKVFYEAIYKAICSKKISAYSKPQLLEFLFNYALRFSKADGPEVFDKLNRTNEKIIKSEEIKQILKKSWKKAVDDKTINTSDGLKMADEDSLDGFLGPDMLPNQFLQEVIFYFFRFRIFPNWSKSYLLQFCLKHGAGLTVDDYQAVAAALLKQLKKADIRVFHDLIRKIFTLPDFSKNIHNNYSIELVALFQNELLPQVNEDIKDLIMAMNEVFETFGSSIVQPLQLYFDLLEYIALNKDKFRNFNKQKLQEFNLFFVANTTGLSKQTLIDMLFTDGISNAKLKDFIIILSESDKQEKFEGLKSDLDLFSKEKYKYLSNLDQAVLIWLKTGEHSVMQKLRKETLLARYSSLLSQSSPTFKNDFLELIESKHFQYAFVHYFTQKQVSETLAYLTEHHFSELSQVKEEMMLLISELKPNEKQNVKKLIEWSIIQIPGYLNKVWNVQKATAYCLQKILNVQHNPGAENFKQNLVRQLRNDGSGKLPNTLKYFERTEGVDFKNFNYGNRKADLNNIGEQQEPTKPKPPTSEIEKASGNKERVAESMPEVLDDISTFISKSNESWRKNPQIALDVLIYWFQYKVLPWWSPYDSTEQLREYLLRLSSVKSKDFFDRLKDVFAQDAIQQQLLNLVNDNGKKADPNLDEVDDLDQDIRLKENLNKQLQMLLEFSGLKLENIESPKKDLLLTYILTLAKIEGMLDYSGLVRMLLQVAAALGDISYGTLLKNLGNNNVFSKGEEREPGTESEGLINESLNLQILEENDQAKFVKQFVEQTGIEGQLPGDSNPFLEALNAILKSESIIHGNLMHRGLPIADLVESITKGLNESQNKVEWPRLIDFISSMVEQDDKPFQNLVKAIIHHFYILEMEEGEIEAVIARIKDSEFRNEAALAHKKSISEKYQVLESINDLDHFQPELFTELHFAILNIDSLKVYADLIFDLKFQNKTHLKLEILIEVMLKDAASTANLEFYKFVSGFILQLEENFPNLRFLKQVVARIRQKHTPSKKLEKEARESNQYSDFKLTSESSKKEQIKSFLEHIAQETYSESKGSLKSDLHYFQSIFLTKIKERIQTEILLKIDAVFQKDKDAHDFKSLILQEDIIEKFFKTHQVLESLEELAWDYVIKTFVKDYFKETETPGFESLQRMVIERATMTNKFMDKFWSAQQTDLLNIDESYKEKVQQKVYNQIEEKLVLQLLRFHLNESKIHLNNIKSDLDLMGRETKIKSLAIRLADSIENSFMTGLQTLTWEKPRLNVFIVQEIHNQLALEAKQVRKSDIDFSVKSEHQGNNNKLLTGTINSLFDSNELSKLDDLVDKTELSISGVSKTELKRAILLKIAQVSIVELIEEKTNTKQKSKNGALTSILVARMENSLDSSIFWNRQKMVEFVLNEIQNQIRISSTRTANQKLSNLKRIEKISANRFINHNAKRAVALSDIRALMLQITYAAINTNGPGNLEQEVLVKTLSEKLVRRFENKFRSKPEEFLLDKQNLVEFVLKEIQKQIRVKIPKSEITIFNNTVDKGGANAENSFSEAHKISNTEIITGMGDERIVQEREKLQKAIDIALKGNSKAEIAPLLVEASLLKFGLSEFSQKVLGKEEQAKNTNSEIQSIEGLFIDALKNDPALFEKIVSKSSNEPKDVDQNQEQIPKKVLEKAELLDDRHKIYIPNAGLVLLWPFLSRFFKKLELVEKNEFVSEEAREKAICLLQFLIDKKEHFPEYVLMLNKIFCGLAINEPIKNLITLSERDKEECELFLEAVKSQWPVLKNTSIQGFIETFLIRDGMLVKKGKDWELKVESKAFDVLMKTLPWGISLIKFPWNNYFIKTEWPA